MNNVLKQLLTLAFGLVFMAGTAVAQNNTADINQDNSGGATPSSATILQGGNLNLGVIDQLDGGGGNHTALIEQVATNNEGRVDQQGTNHDAKISQWGVGDNFARSFQRGISATSTQKQNGEENRALVSQSTQFQKAIQEQEGYKNFARALQGRTRANFSRQVQVGQENVAKVFQTGTFVAGPAFPNNVAKQFQTGDLNTAVTTQDNADGNRAITTQSGVGGHTGVIFQDTDNNLATIDQSGSGHTATVTQSGSVVVP